MIIASDDPASIKIVLVTGGTKSSNIVIAENNPVDFSTLHLESPTNIKLKDDSKDNPDIPSPEDMPSSNMLVLKTEKARSLLDGFIASSQQGDNNSIVKNGRISESDTW